MIGPSGDLGGAGSRPRLPGTVCTSKVWLSGIHCTGSPIMELIFTPSRRAADAAATLPSHNSIPSGVVLVKANCVPLGDHTGALKYALAGSPVTLRVLPVATSTRLSPMRRGGW